MPHPSQHPEAFPTRNQLRNPLPLPAFSDRNRLQRMLAIEILDTLNPRSLRFRALHVQDMGCDGREMLGGY